MILSGSGSVVLIIAAFVLGYLPGWFYRVDLFESRSSHNKILRFFLPKIYKDVWGVILHRLETNPGPYPYIRITTDSGTYEGVLWLWSTGRSKNIMILRPKRLIIDENGKETAREIGKEMYFSEPSIKSIIFLDNVTYKSDLKD